MSDLETLVELLKKIDKTTDKVHIEIDRDGLRWFWKIPQQNLTASEYIPKNVKREERIRSS